MALVERSEMKPAKTIKYRGKTWRITRRSPGGNLIVATDGNVLIFLASK